MLDICLITRSCFERKLGKSCIAPIATGKASSVSLNEERKREASAGPPPLRGSAVRSLTSCRPCNSLRRSIDNPALSATFSAAETAPFPANLSASPSGSSLQSASTWNTQIFQGGYDRHKKRENWKREICSLKANTLLIYHLQEGLLSAIMNTDKII